MTHHDDDPDEVRKGSGKQFGEDLADLEEENGEGETPEGSGKEFSRGQSHLRQPGDVPRGSGKQFREHEEELEPQQPPGTPEGSGKQFSRGQSDQQP